jgi:hypothetical protein
MESLVKKKMKITEKTKKKNSTFGIYQVSCFYELFSGLAGLFRLQESRMK